ncbi:uncharacterized protein LOC129240748 [Anastrepha obliqua]|uniref:uncharacterized protein LOC129240748 n=1 Tax=Anastrepha obliqua TaxID=95512 RepID=UPI00240A8BF3|nr:uncharacterized protein LOC129240748 [Anastrepha obliqua]
MGSEENINYQLAENFIFFHDILKQPEEVFDCRSHEYELASAWLNKLSTGIFETTEELRQRNIYMSHLVACLNYGKLTGPFLSPPKQNPFHDTADFQTKVKARRICQRPTPGMSTSEKACAAGVRPTPCECEYLCCDNDESRRDQKKDCNGSSFDRICGYMKQYVNVPACLEASLQPILKVRQGQYQTRETGNNKTKVPSAPSYANGDRYERSARASGVSYRDCGNVVMKSGKKEGDNTRQNMEFAEQQTYGRIRALLDVIFSELSGESTPGTNDFLESELARYKNFIMNYSVMGANMLQWKSQPALRSFLLMQLQNDLVKLLNESS